MPSASTCDYAGCAKTGWRLRFCAVLSLPLVLIGVESINVFQHEISCWPVPGQKPCENPRGGASVLKASASDARPQAQNRATGNECECCSTQGAWWVRQPFVTKAGLGSEPTQRRIQSRFGRADQFPGVTKLCRRNGAANWAECSGGGVRSRGCFGASQFSGLLNQKFSWPEIWRGGRVDFDATERAHSGTEARLTRNGGGEVWSRPPRK